MRHSIRRRLLSWLLLPLLLLSVILTFVSYWDIRAVVRDIFDKQLLNSADIVASRVRSRNGRIEVDLPPGAQAVLRHHYKDKFRYAILDSKLGLISGDRDLPAPPVKPVSDSPIFWAAVLHGEEMRLAAIAVAVPAFFDDSVVVEVAETRYSRQSLANYVTFIVLLPQLILIVLAATIAWVAVGKGLKQLSELQREIEQRSLDDLSQIDESHAPMEVQSLVSSLNRLLGRLQEEIQTQKRFTANAAHQLRTPIAGIKTFVSIALRTAREKDMIDFLQHIQSGVNRMSRLVNQMLSLARTDTDAMKRVAVKRIDLNDLASEVAEEFVPLSISCNLELGYQDASVPAYINGDPVSLREMISNLVDNAIRYSGRGGNVNVMVTVNGCVSLIVEDDGPGIPKEHRTLVFERFYRILGRDVPGSGLGLSIVNEIARAHGAEIFVSDGAGGKGTKFTVKFPAVDIKRAGPEVSPTGL